MTESEHHLVKRYGGDRLYDTATLRYLGVAQLRSMVRGGTELTVVDAASGADITAEVLRPPT